MVKFPTYDRQQGLGGGATASYASDGAFSAPARAIAGMGNALADVGDQFAAAQKKIRATQDDAWFSKARAETTVNMIAAEREAQQAATGEAASYMNDIGGRFTTYRDQKLAEAPSPRAQQLYTQWADSFGVGVTERASQFQAGSELAARSDNFAQAMNAHAQTIFADPTQYDVVYRRAMDDFAGAKQWMDPAQEAKAREAIDRDFKLARARALPPDQLLKELGTGRSGGQRSGSVVDRIIGAESGGDPNAQNDRSSAGGVGQFIDSTWVQTVRKYRPDIARGASNDQIIELKQDGKLAREMTVRLTEENAAGLRAAGMPDTDRNVYLAHFAGLNGAKKILSASDDAPIASVMSADQIAANPFLSGKTVGDVKAWADGKMGGSRTGSSGPVPNVQFIDATGGKVRDKPVQGWVRDGLARAAAATDQRIAIKIVSGGQNSAAEGGKRTGSKRHDHGNAADIVLVVDGKEVLPSQDKALYARFFRNAAAAGFKGLGHYEWGIHVGGGAQAAWGPDRSSRTLDPEFAKAAAEGWGNPSKDRVSEDGVGSTEAQSFADNPYYAGLSIDDILSLQNNAQQTVKQRDAAEYAAIKEMVPEGIARGTITSEAQIFESGLKGGDLLTAIGQLRTAQEQGRNLAAAWTKYDDGTLALDPYNEKDRSLVDKMEESIDRLAPQASPSPSDGVGSTAVPNASGVAPIKNAWVNDVVKRYGIVPKTVVSQINQDLESADIPRVAAAAERASQINSLNGAAFARRENGGRIADAVTIYDHFTKDLGMQPEDAARKMLALKDPTVKRERSTLSTEAGKFVSGLKVTDVTAAYDTWKTWEPGAGAVPAQINSLLTEYRELAEEKFYEAGGDPGLAKALALKDIKGRWSVSSISGSPQLMRNPPEAYYPPVNGSHEYLRADALQTAKSYVSDMFPGREVKNIAIVPSKETREDIEKGRPPRYRLFYLYEEDGFVKSDEVFAGPWGLPVDDVEKALKSSQDGTMNDFLSRWGLESSASDIEDAGEGAAQRALDETVGPDWMKAKAAEAARERAKMDADTLRRSSPPPSDATEDGSASDLVPTPGGAM